MRWGKLLCRLGLHRWEYVQGMVIPTRLFRCYRCHRPRQLYQGYNGRWYWEG